MEELGIALALFILLEQRGAMKEEENQIYSYSAFPYLAREALASVQVTKGDSNSLRRTHSRGGERNLSVFKLRADLVTSILTRNEVLCKLYYIDFWGLLIAPHPLK